MEARRRTETRGSAPKTTLKASGSSVKSVEPVKVVADALGEDRSMQCLRQKVLPAGDAEEAVIKASRLIAAARETVADRDAWAGLTDRGSVRAKMVEHDKLIAREDRSKPEGQTE